MDFFIALYNYYEISLLHWESIFKCVWGTMLASRNRKLLASPSSSIWCKYIIKVSWICDRSGRERVRARECALIVHQTPQTHALTHTHAHKIQCCVIVGADTFLSHIVCSREMPSKMILICTQFRNSFPLSPSHSQCAHTIYSRSACSMFNLNNH